MEPSNLLLRGLFGAGIASLNNLKGAQAAQITIIPLIMGVTIPSIAITLFVADQKAKSLPPPVLQNPDIVVAPASRDYGNVNVGSSASRIFVVSNRGTAELDVTATTLSGNNANEFAFVSGSGPFKVPPGATHDVEVSFTPTFVGAKSASLDITSNDPDQPTINRTLSGTGVIPDIAVAPTFHNYGNVNVGSSASRIFVVSNRGTAELDVTATTLSGNNANEFAFVSGSGPFKVPPGATHDVEVSFTPTFVGAKSASLDITSDDPDQSTVNIALSGAGNIP